jgi:hypothetical protein
VGRLTVAAAACLAVASLIVAPSWVLASPNKAQPGTSCARGYSYGGYASREGVHGVAATVAALSVPRVSSGHAAAWVGVGGLHQAQGGRNAWLQTGIAAFSHTGLRLYVEEVSLGQARRFADLGPARLGHRYRFELRETRPDVWLAYVDGLAAGTPAYLPTGGGSWRGVVTSESWAGGRESCNRFAYRFEDVDVLAGPSWRALEDARLVGSPVTGVASGFAAAKPS